jgi:predicted permease
MGERAGVNTIVSEKLYQRAQVYTWSREAKVNAFREWGIRAVINFWPKLDPEMCDMDLDWVWQVSAPRSLMMLGDHIDLAAEAATAYLKSRQDRRLLVLCEAGKTRSVYFCVLVVQKLLGLDSQQALKLVLGVVPTAKLKPAMLARFTPPRAGATIVASGG